jgi:hypothetical protein
VNCFSTSDGSNGINYYRMYHEIEQLVDFYNWSIAETKKLTVRERRHWYQRVKNKIENRK